MSETIVAVAGGSGFIGGTIVRRLVGAGMHVRVLTRRPESARRRFGDIKAEFVRADLTEPDTLGAALTGVQAVVNAAQFDGYPVENPRRGLTFERIDYGGTVALLKAASAAAVHHFVYISGAAADEHSTHPAFRAKGRAERAIRESGLAFTVFRPTLVYGPGDRVVNLLARLVRLSPVFVAPGTGRQKVQPLSVEDLAHCVALAIAHGGHNRTFEIGGPEVMTFDDLVRLLMELTGRRRPIVHTPEALLRIAGAIGEMMPRPQFSRDAVTFVVADTVCDNQPMLSEFGVTLTPPRVGMGYLAEPRR